MIFAFHGYPGVIHRPGCIGRTDHNQSSTSAAIKEEGTTTTPFDMVVRNDLDRYHLAMDVLHRVPGLATRTAPVAQFLRDRLIDHHAYVTTHGEDMPEVRDWAWKPIAPADGSKPG